MMKRFRIALIILVVAVVAGTVWLVLPEPQPAYQGKRLSTWLTQYAASADGGASELQAEEAIRAIDTNGLPILLKWIGSKDSILRGKVIALSRKQTLVKIPCHTDEEKRIIARVGFGVLGSNAAPAVPALIDLLNNDGDSDVQGEVVMALGRIGPAAQDAVPAIIKCLNGTNHFAALFAPTVLATIHKKPELVIPALIQHLEDSKSKPLHTRRTIEAIVSVTGSTSGKGSHRYHIYESYDIYEQFFIGFTPGAGDGGHQRPGAHVRRTTAAHPGGV